MQKAEYIGGGDDVDGGTASKQILSLCAFKLMRSEVNDATKSNRTMVR